MNSGPDKPFAALKEVAARLDVEIPNAANSLEGPRTSAACTSARKVSEMATLLEAEVKLIELRLEKVVKEKLASIQELTECLNQTDRDNKDTLQKLIPLGFKVPDHLLPALQNLSLESYQFTAKEAADDTLEDSACSLSRIVTNLEPAFSKAAAGSSQLRKPSQVPSHLSRSLQRTLNSKPASRTPPRCFRGSSNLNRYLEEIDDEDTVTAMNYKRPASQTAAKPAVHSGTPERESAAPMQKRIEFEALKQSLLADTFTCGMQPLPRTPEFTRSTLGQSKESCPPTPQAPDYEGLLLELKERRTVTAKTPELTDFLPPVLKENVS
ncbi:uncharacterized protein LOC142585336 isoform X3 [Dermacentor variabilis]|uniref:uncharacterized protein LOC142585336 isoform X3 n=1 Tax=Dermacentor variabilis TaxID=34621 RepID=UPI003F5B4581